MSVTDLNAVFRQVRLEGEHFTGVDVRIMSLLEGFLQLFQLITCKDSPK